MVDFRVSVVLPAGGSGSRMGIDLPKQYFRILGRPLISYTIEAFERIPWINHIVITGPATEHQLKILENIILDFDHKKVITTSGSFTRHRSIFNGIQCLNSHDRTPDIVVIHDAVRPFIEETFLKDVVLAARKHGACGAVKSLVSTVIARKHDGLLDHSLDRSKYIGSEMPQAFQFDVILNAYQKCTELEFDHGTECLQLALKYSHTHAFLIDGPDYLWKVTYKKDLFAIEGILKERFRQRAKFLTNIGESPLEKETEKRLNAKGVKVLQEDDLKSFKTNILIHFRSLDQHKIGASGSGEFKDEMILQLEHVDQNGILILVDRGSDKELLELKVSVQHIARQGKEKRITCCAVWCNYFVLGFPTQNSTTCNKLNDIAQMIVNVAMETPLSLTGQVFTVLDTT